MDFKTIQEKVIKTSTTYCKMCNFTMTIDCSLIKLYEEVGELSEAILIDRKYCNPNKNLPELEAKQKIAEELADVLGITIVLADLLKVDLEKALEQKWFGTNWSNIKKLDTKGNKV